MPLNSHTPEPGGAPGVLYVVATPLGALEDITHRAVRILSEVDLIAAEDTRRTLKLLSHYHIHNRLESCHEHNEAGKAEALVRELERGASIALVSDSGTPLMSDPGFRLVSLAAERGITITPVPGPCAAVAGLSASGLPTDRFIFCGFPPRKAGKLKESLNALRGAGATLVFYESPRRITGLIKAMIPILGDLQGALARELTKVHEEFIRGSLSEILARLEERESVKGECTLMASCPAQAPDPEATLDKDIEKGLSLGRDSASQLASTLAKKYGLAKRIIYERVLKVQGRKPPTK